jgi:hypothetical protein
MRAAALLFRSVFYFSQSCVLPGCYPGHVRSRLQMCVCGLHMCGDRTNDRWSSIQDCILCECVVINFLCICEQLFTLRAARDQSSYSNTDVT